MTDDDLKEVMTQITKLNPKPGGNVTDVNKAESYVVPDFFIYNNSGKLELTLNSKNAPELRISEGYRDMLKDYDRGSKKDRRQKEAVLFIKQKNRRGQVVHRCHQAKATHVAEYYDGYYESPI